MSGTKQTTRVTTHDTKSLEADAADKITSPLLDQIVAEMNTLAQKATRVSPIRLRTFEDLERFALIAARSSVVPKDYQNRPENCLIAIQMGSELGLAPMQSLQNIAVINGRPALWGDALPGLCRASGVLEYMKEWHEGSDDALIYHCQAKRRDDPNVITHSFSVADAKTAKLWGKRGSSGQDTPWITHPGRMLQMRARGFCLRDACPDVLRGLITVEEARDIPWSDTGLSMPEPVVVEPEPEEKPRTWSDIVRGIKLKVDAATSEDEIVALGDDPDVTAVMRDAGPKAQAVVNDLLSDAMQRVREAPLG